MATPDKSLESWIWDAACSIREAKDAPKYKDYLLPLIFTKRLCDVFDGELNRIAKEVGSLAKAFRLVKHDKKLVRFYLPLKPDNPDDPVWTVIRKLTDKIGEQLTTHLRAIADENPLLKGIIDRVDFNATTHGVRDLAEDRLSNLIERIGEKRLGLADVEPDIVGRSSEYLIRKFAPLYRSTTGAQAMKRWQDKDEFKKRVLEWVGKLGVEVRSLSVCPMRKKWASCSLQGNLNFNADLVALDREIAD